MRTAKPVAIIIVILGVLSFAAPALAVVVPAPPTGTRTGSNTEFTFTSLGPGQGVTGFIANPDNPFDPVQDGYPAGNPTSGFSPENLGFAGVLRGTPAEGGGQLSLYCIDLLTNTNTGVGYELGTWDAATVPNVGYVARLLNSYFPTVATAPPGLANDNQRAAATQAAIWFFTDRYVLNTADPLHNTVSDVVAAVIAAGPLVEPPPPSLVIAPATLSGPEGSAVGPFTVTSAVGNANVTGVGGTLFADAAATQPIANGATVASGMPIWLRSTGPATAVLHATAQATVPTGNVYLYDGNTPGKTKAQKLILAETGTLRTTVNAQAEFRAPGSLVVSKSIDGPAAGQQGAVTIEVSCDGTALPDFVIPAGTTASPQLRTYSGVAAGSRCTVTETVDGRTAQVTVVVVGSGQEVTVPAGATATATLSDTYGLRPGALVVRKTIAGPGAGQQGAVTIAVTCDGTALESFVNPAGTPGGTTERLYPGIPSGQVCTITETGNGETTAVSVTVTGSGQTVTVPPGDAVLADLTDTYVFRPGSLTVTKSIAGPAAGQQGAVTIAVTCNGTMLQPLFVIPAGTPAGAVSQTYDDIPGNATCTVLETADGSSSAVAVVKGRSGEQVTIPPGGSASVEVSDTYLTGALVVNKTITGRAGGQEGDVTITVACPGLTFDPFVIPAGTPAGTVSAQFTGILEGATCTVTETADGSTATVTVTTEGSPQQVTIGPAGTGTANLVDTYEFVPGALTVDKTVAGPSAGQQGGVTISVICDGTALADFVIPAGTLAGTVSQTYDDIPGDTSCTIIETANGRTRTVAVTVVGGSQEVTVPAGGTATVDVNDSYEPAAGVLVVRKTITGSAAGQQGPITITVACAGVALPDVVIPAGTAAGTVTRGVTGIPAGSACTISETADGTTDTVDVEVDDHDQTVTVPAGAVVVVAITNTYSNAAGSLVVTKTLAGPAAGQQGGVAILVGCGGPAHTFGFLIPAGAAAGPVPRSYDDIPAGSTCTVTEVIDGGTAAVSVVGAGSGQRVVVPAGGTVTADLTDTFQQMPTTTTAPQPRPRPLPATGRGEGRDDMLIIGIGALVVGAALLAASRRRSSASRG